MTKIQERIKTDYKAMEERRGMVQQCSGCGIRYRSHEVQTLCSDCEEQQQVAQPVVEEAPVVEEPSTEAQETLVDNIHALIIEKQERRPGKPSQDILALLLREAQEEGPGNDGLLFAYIKEAHETLEDLVLLLNEERLYKRVLSGETVRVQVARTGKEFTIRTTPDNATGLPAYDILSPSGKVEKRGIILNKSELRTWMYGLVEVD